MRDKKKRNTTKPKDREFDDMVNAIVEGVIKGLTKELDREIDHEAMPPKPKMLEPHITGRGKEDRSYHKFTTTVDIELWKLFHQDMDKHNLSTGRMLDVVLWRYYNKPKLSYEEDREADKQE